jgi:hypothetical protein
MIIAQEAVIAHLRADVSLMDLANNQLGAKHQYGASGGQWTPGSASLVVMLDGGFPDIYLPWQQPRLEVRCYGPTVYEAALIYSRLVEVSRETSRARVTTEKGLALVYWLLMESSPSQLYDPDLEMDFLMVFMRAAVNELSLT